MRTDTSGGLGRRAAVIGAGFGGLASAIRLQAAGVQTTIFEARDKPGGRAYVYEDSGFKFDAGPTVITAPESLEELFQLAGKKLADYVELIPVSPMYRLFWEDGETFDYSSDEADLLREIARLSPEDVAGYRRYFEYATEVFRIGYEELCHVPFLHFSDMVRVAPELLRLKAYRSVYATVAKYFKSEKLRQAFSFNSLLIGGHPFKASAIYSLIHPLERKWGAFFPRGGTHALVRALVRLFEELGGQVRLSAPVRQIATDHGAVTGVIDSAGHHEPFDLVVSNADVVTTYARLLDGEPRAARKARALAKKDISMSLFVMYFGLRGPAYAGLTQHNVLFGHRYRELLDDIFSKGVVADDFSLYLHAPSVTDPEMAPPGMQSFYVLSPVPHLGHGHFDWKKDGDAYAERILRYLESRYMPDLRERLVTKRTFTPLDFKSELGAHLGNAFSLAPTLTQSAYFRVHNRDADISGLYFAGAGTHPGAGVPGVIGSAKATFSVIAKDLALVPDRASVFSAGRLRDAHA